MKDSISFWREYKIEFGSVKKPLTIEVVERLITYASFKVLDESKIAYILATCYHETGFDFIPKREYGTAAYFIKRYWENTKVRKWLGNDSPEEAVKYCGRGLIQITGEINYLKFGIADTPERALQTETAIHIAVDGMIIGAFTGKKLSDYINNKVIDYVGARKIINGSDKADTIANYARKFLKILA